GIIDANVMGGISKYQQAFFIPEFSKQHPEFIDHVYRLKALTLDQIQVLESSLHLHGQLAPPGVQPLHRRLQERFAQLKQGLRDLGSLTIRNRGKSQSDTSQAASIVNTPLPPLPTEKKHLLTSSSETPSNRSSASSSSAFGHLLLSAEEQGFSKFPQLESLTLPPPPPPIPQREMRPRSAGPVPRPPKPTHQRSHSKPFSFPTNTNPATSSPPDGPQLRNSWSETGVEEAPPLPPRGQTPDKRNTSLFIDTSHTPPAPPKRLVKKMLRTMALAKEDDVRICTKSNNDGHDLRDSGYSEFSQTPSSSI
ncbi:hypothetical protein L9F63_012662, partial [Diploptera punctata]